MRMNPLDDAWAWILSVVGTVRDTTEPVWQRMAPGDHVGILVVVALAGIGVASTLFRPAWKVTRHGVTIVHEMGHATMAVAMRRRIQGIKLHTDTSGVALTSGKPRGPGMLLTLMSGYTAPSTAGAVMLVCVSRGWSGAALTAVCALLVLALLLVRNLWGIISVGTALLVAAFVWWFQAGEVSTALTAAIAGVLLSGGLRATFDLVDAHRRGEGAQSDAGQAGALTHLPSVLWLAYFQAHSVLAVLVSGYALVHLR